jgi:hypothetical protein
MNGLLRVGGRLKRSAKLTLGETNPVLKANITLQNLSVLHFHESGRYHGRDLPDGAIRTAEYWITACKRLVY